MEEKGKMERNDNMEDKGKMEDKKAFVQIILILGFKSLVLLFIIWSSILRFVWSLFCANVSNIVIISIKYRKDLIRSWYNVMKELE